MYPVRKTKGARRMRYRTLGKTGLKVSEIGFGPEWMDGTLEETREIAEVLREAGVNYMDCWMADPHIRENLGFAMRGHADEWIVQGHIGSCWVGSQYKRSRNVSLVRPAFEEELRLLDVDHFEIGMMHYIDSVVELVDSLEGPYYEYVQELLQAGTIRHVGLSTHNPEVTLEAVRRGVVEVIMFSINPAFDLLPPSEDVNDLFGDFANAGERIEPLRAELYSLCEENDVALTVMKPYAGGRLLNAEQSPFGVALTPVQCIHYCLTRPAVASVLSGYKTVAEVQDALAYENATDSERDFAATIAAAPERRAYFGQCTYCGHCQPCVVGIDIATVNKFADLALAQDEVPTGIREHYLALDKNASDCIGCGSCEPNCPFGVKIVERMEETAELFA